MYLPLRKSGHVDFVGRANDAVFGEEIRAIVSCGRRNDAIVNLRNVLDTQNFVEDLGSKLDDFKFRFCLDKLLKMAKIEHNAAFGCYGERLR